MSANSAVAPATRRHRLTAVLVGLAIPAGGLGYTALAAVAAAALLAGLAVPDRATHLRRVLLMLFYHPVGLLCGLMLALWLPDLAISFDARESAETWARIAIAIAGAAYLWSILDRNDRLIGIARDSLALSALLLVGASAAALLYAPDWIAEMRNSPDDPWMRYRQFAAALACLAPVLAWIAATARGWRRFAAALALVPALAVSVGGGGLAFVACLGGGVALAAYCAGLRTRAARAPLALLGLALAAALVAALLATSGTTVEDTGALGLPLWLADFRHQNIWAFMVERIPDAPWFGRGLNALARIPGADHLLPGTTPFTPSHPHNWALEIVAETGAFGFAPVLLLVIGLFARDARALAAGGGARIAARLAMVATFFAIASFNFSIWAPWWGLTLLFLLLIASARPECGGAPPRMLVVVGEVSDFVARRLTLARAAETAGYAVGVVCEGVDAQRKVLDALGLPVHVWPLKRFSGNPWRRFQAIGALRRIYEAVEPRLVHHVGPRPVAYGAIAARLAGVPFALGTIDGADFPFDRLPRPGGLKRRWMRPLGWAMDRPGATLLAQNPEDARALRESGIVAPGRIAILPGAGVDTEAFRPVPEPEGGPVVVTQASRMLWTKGVRETVAAARLLKERELPVTVRLVGDVDPGNPNNVHPATLSLWNADGWVAWTGARPDMPKVWAESHIAVLASHHEGVPQSLLEAAASGRPLIAADVPGCRELVINGETGILVPPRDPKLLADAIARLAEDPEARRRMGAAARAKVEAAFAEPAIEARTLALYRGLDA